MQYRSGSSAGSRCSGVAGRGERREAVVHERPLRPPYPRGEQLVAGSPCELPQTHAGDTIAGVDRTAWAQGPAVRFRNQPVTTRRTRGIRAERRRPGPCRSARARRRGAPRSTYAPATPRRSRRLRSAGSSPRCWCSGRPASPPCSRRTAPRARSAPATSRRPSASPANARRWGIISVIVGACLVVFWILVSLAWVAFLVLAMHHMDRVVWQDGQGWSNDQPFGGPVQPGIPMPQRPGTATDAEPPDRVKTGRMSDSPRLRR